ncbi:helix-turn-helix transcriptional regulator [Raoultibacter phocaeensis]|uniref:helix-turn-helix transcriptional regulator n=1 Tax=Raoultibacter phocaeensis TaxID=2479841 RepID=UPI0011183CB0|nr:helix-turn-helix domain-containing protein [Raoultibacter phocaeensis]
MAITFPRISITVDDDRGTGTQGELNILALGFGIHQSWIYTAMFGTTTIFQAPQALGPEAESSISLVFLISIVVFGLSLLFAAATDQRFLKFYTAKRAIIAAAALTAIGTFAVFAVNVPGFVGIAATWFAGISTGIGSALLLLFWGIAFSRHGAATIVMNTAVAIVIAIALYSFVLHIIPPPFSGILTGCLPLLELPLLWRLTPVSYALRHAVPIFNPLPVRKMPFSVRLAIPTLLFGFALGALRSISTQIILPSSDLTTQLLALFAGGAATVLLLVTSFCIDKRSHWDFLFRPLIPFIAVTLFFLPTLPLGSSVLEPLVLLTGYMCFEALMWVFFGEMAQEFRLSPIFVFGIGRGCLALGSLAGSLSVADPSILGSLTPFGEAGGAVLIMFVMVMAYALLPRVRDIKRIVIRPEPQGYPAIATFNRQVELAAGRPDRAEADAGGALEHATESEHAPTRPDIRRTRQPLSEQVEQGASSASSASSPARAGLRAANANGMIGHPSEAATPGMSARAAEEADTARKSGRFRAQCEAIADRYLLSRRETEVMFLLAKGYNAAYIQDKLCISKSTAKTHIGHIYRKLNIHNQQELLLMVEETDDDSRMGDARR